MTAIKTSADEQVEAAGFPALPGRRTGMVFDMHNSPWRANVGAELLAAAVLQACMDVGECRPLSAEEIGKTLNRYHSFHVMNTFYKAGWQQLLATGDVTIVCVEGVAHLSPQPSFVTKALGENVKFDYHPEYRQPPGTGQEDVPVPWDWSDCA